MQRMHFFYTPKRPDNTLVFTLDGAMINPSQQYLNSRMENLMNELEPMEQTS